ncbi:hypothetical protein Ctob_016395 [Chrysochromulina tobinii]|uniref:Apple domain-containing protein n=1 Tax=Chrysochromulina tobinii TaxID=1460289 RepID=A0A0M0LSG3_9EUKA|nr:hypothetical protein Ctob_016395 [Chrysochromulina tobinii]|eukprot:KOO53693.1 hypothetical protein Ctob_016395 [Chrysochromulina sp. CCMP291]
MLVAAGALLFASSTMPALAPSFTTAMARVPTSSTRLNELETAVASLDAQVRQLLGSLPPTTPNSGTALKSAPAAAPVQAATASATPKAMTSLERAVAAAAVPTNSSTTSLPAAPVDVVPWTTLANASCNAKLHAGYGGGAFTWGMTFKVSSAQECCDACTAHARTCVDQISVGQPYYERRWQGNTTVERCPSHMSSNEEGTHKAAPCNIWVFCPTLLEDGGLCWSNDVWNHSYGECWLKNQPKPERPWAANRKPKGGLARMKQDALLSERSKSHTRALAAAEQHQLAHEAVLAAANAEAAAITAWTHRDRDVAFAEPTADDIIFVEKHTADEESAAPEQQQQEQPKKAEAPAAGAALELDVLKCDEPTEVPIEAPLTGRQMRLLEALQAE